MASLCTMLPALCFAAALAFSATASPFSIAPRSSFTDCLSCSSKPVYPSSPNYSSDVQSYNQALQPQPATIIYPTTVQEVSQALLCAQASNVSVSVRSGGHSYASFGLAGQLVLSLDQFNAITVDASTNAWIGAGARLGDVAVALNNQNRAMPHGTCPWVGVGGHFSFGGFGYPSRMWGMAMDNILAVDVVLADGSIRSGLTREQDPDLFWALNGSAASFGVITRFYVKTYAVPTNTIVFNYAYETLTPEIAAVAFARFQDFSITAPTTVGIAFTVGAGNTGVNVNIGGVFYGTWTEYEVMWNLLRALPKGYTKSEKGLSWIDSVRANGGGRDLTTAGQQDSRDTFFAKSLMTPSSAPISQSAMENLFTYLHNTPTDAQWWIEINLYGGNGSYINTIPLSQSSFGHRDRLFGFQMYASSSNYSPPLINSVHGFVAGMQAAVVKTMGSAWTGQNAWSSYVNYVDPTLTNKEVKSLYWGSQYSRLAKLKTKYDPFATFRSGQSIRGA